MERVTIFKLLHLNETEELVWGINSERRPGSASLLDDLSSPALSNHTLHPISSLLQHTQKTFVSPSTSPSPHSTRNPHINSLNYCLRCSFCLLQCSVYGSCKHVSYFMLCLSSRVIHLLCSDSAARPTQWLRNPDYSIRAPKFSGRRAGMRCQKTLRQPWGETLNSLVVLHLLWKPPWRQIETHLHWKPLNKVMCRG